MSKPAKSRSSFRSLEFAVVLLIAGIILAMAITYYSKYQADILVQARACINNLRQLDAAKREWALENGKTNGVVCTENDITPYLKLDAKGDLPKCPSGGTYTIGEIGEPPTCSLGTNVNPPHV